MQQHKFLARVRKALTKHGIIGTRAKALLEEWNDHLQSEVEKLVAGGQDRESSYQDACKALGEPESLVDSAAKQLAMESWQGRNPVLSSGILSLVVFILGILIMGYTLYTKIKGIGRRRRRSIAEENNVMEELARILVQLPAVVINGKRGRSQ